MSKKKKTNSLNKINGLSDSISNIDCAIYDLADLNFKNKEINVVLDLLWYCREKVLTQCQKLEIKENKANKVKA